MFISGGPGVSTLLCASVHGADADANSVGSNVTPSSYDFHPLKHLVRARSFMGSQIFLGKSLGGRHFFNHRKAFLFGIPNNRLPRGTGHATRPESSTLAYKSGRDSCAAFETAARHLGTLS
jgi:hypothetical protein